MNYNVTKSMKDWKYSINDDHDKQIKQEKIQIIADQLMKHKHETQSASFACLAFSFFSNLFPLVDCFNRTQTNRCLHHKNRFPFQSSVHSVVFDS